LLLLVTHDKFSAHVFPFPGITASVVERMTPFRRKTVNGKLPKSKFWLLLGLGLVLNRKSMSLTHPLTTTAFELTDYRITKSFGVVRGIVVRSRSIVGNIGASIQTIFGGNISIYTELCERARADAFQKMLEHAGQQGANAVIGVRYDATEIATGVSEVLCYGTAVFVEPARAT